MKMTGELEAHVSCDTVFSFPNQKILWRLQAEVDT